jgi:hypothetical protein
VSRSQPACPSVFFGWGVFFGVIWWIVHIWNLVDCPHLGGLFHFGCYIWGLMDPLFLLGGWYGFFSIIFDRRVWRYPVFCPFFLFLFLIFFFKPLKVVVASCS